MNDLAPNSSPNSSFSHEIPTLQLAWDSHSFGALCKCPRYYEYTIVRGYSTFGESDDLKFGLIFHSALELYDHEIANGCDHDAATILAVRHALIETWDFDLRRPWTSDSPQKTRNTLLRSIVWYLDKYKDSPLETVILANGQPAVEHSFSFNTDITTDLTRFGIEQPYVICGHLDRVKLWNGQKYIKDVKTTKFELDATYFAQFLPDNQMQIYEIAGNITLDIKVEGILIDAMQVLVNGTRFRRHPIPSSPELLEEFLTDFEIRMRENEGYVRLNYWPMNRKACGFGRLQCAFRPICSMSPEARQDWLDANYSRRVWDPLVAR